MSYVFGPARRRQRRLRARAKQLARRARCHDRPRNLDSRRSAGHRAARHQLLGEQGPLRSAAALSDEQLSPGDRRANGKVDSDVRQRRRRQFARGARPRSGDDRQDAVVEPRQGVREPHHPRIGGRRELHGASRRSARVRRRDRQARLAVPHHPASGRVRVRDVASRRVEIHRRRQHVGRNHGRSGEGHRVLSARIADLRFLRRRPARRKSVRLVAAGAERAHGKAAVALPDGPPRSVGLRQRGGAAVDDRAPQRQDDRRRRASRQDRVPLRVRSRHGRAVVAHRRAARASERNSRRSGVAHSAVSDRAAAVRAAEAQCRRHQSVHSDARTTRDLEEAHRRCAQRGAVHAACVERHRLDSRRAGRRELGLHGGRSREGHRVRVEHQRAVDLQAEHRGARAGRRRQSRRPRGDRARPYALRAEVRDVPRCGLERVRKLSVARGHHRAHGAGVAERSDRRRPARHAALQRTEPCRSRRARVVSRKSQRGACARPRSGTGPGANAGRRSGRRVRRRTRRACGSAGPRRRNGWPRVSARNQGAGSAHVYGLRHGRHDHEAAVLDADGVRSQHRHDQVAGAGWRRRSARRQGRRQRTPATPVIAPASSPPRPDCCSRREETVCCASTTRKTAACSGRGRCPRDRVAFRRCTKRMAVSSSS